MFNFSNLIRNFSQEEDGIALTEYLILLGLLTGAVVTAVVAAGGNLATAWNDWVTFFGDLDGRAPTLDEAPEG